MSRIRVFCDASAHWRKVHPVGALERLPAPYSVWINASGTPSTIRMDHLKGDRVTEPDDGIMRPFASLDRRRFRLWCPRCGDGSVLVIRGERLDAILDAAADTPGDDITLEWLAANL